MIPIAGIQQFTTIDFPGALSCVIFTQGCPWRCRYCQNPELQEFSAGKVTWGETLKFLRSRRSFLDAVVVSGGEPTAHMELEAALIEIRAMGYKVGLHTAGIYPERFKKILPHLDWVGFDLKAPFDESYDKITMIKNSAMAVQKSLDYLLKSGVSAQYRCTYHPLLLTETALQNLKDYLVEREIHSPLVIQKFRPQGCRDTELALATRAFS